MKKKKRVVSLVTALYKYRYEIFLFLIFFFALAFRLYFTFQTPYFSDDSAYLTLREINYMKENKTPMLYDDLSYGGKDVLHLPLYPYIMAFFSFIPYGLKIVPAIFISSLVFIVYLITLKLCDNKFTALMSAIISAFIPVVISSTLNRISVFSLILPLLFLMFYSFVKIKDKAYFYVFIALSFLLPLLHPLAVFVAISLIIFYILVLAENIELSSLAKESMIFSVFLSLLITFLFFKGPFLSLGFKFVWQNTPSAILANYFKNLNIIDAILKLGVIPFVLGVFGLTLGFFRDKHAYVFLFISSAFTALLLLVFKLVDFSSGLILLGVTLSIASSLAICKFFKYLKLTKISGFHFALKALLILLVFSTLVVSSFSEAQNVLKNTLSEDEFLVLQSIKDSTEPDSTILSLFSEGHYITALGERKNVMDSDFLTAPSVNTRYSDVQEIYTSVSEVKALQLLEKYSIDYIYLTPKARKFYNFQDLGYVKNDKCFVEYRKSGEVYLYKVRC